MDVHGRRPDEDDLGCLERVRAQESKLQRVGFTSIDGALGHLEGHVPDVIDLVDNIQRHAFHCHNPLCFFGEAHRHRS